MIAGAGLAAQRAAETLRRNGYDGRLQMVSEGRVAPYDRPPLSKEVLAGVRAATSGRMSSAVNDLGIACILATGER